MRQIKDLNTLIEFIKDYEELKKINKKLHRYYEIHCNYGLTDRQLKRCEKLEERVFEIAKKWDLIADITGDPRGVPICLIEDDKQFRYNGLVIPL